VSICSAFKEHGGVGKQQVAILAKENAQAAWAEKWKSMEGIDPPRGFAFAWFKIRGADVGIYSVHLKSNLIMRGDKAEGREKNVHKREVAARQVVGHIHEVIEAKMPNVRSIVVGGDFNTNAEEFADDTSLETLVKAGFASCMNNVAPTMRVTHPAGMVIPIRRSITPSQPSSSPQQNYPSSPETRRRSTSVISTPFIQYRLRRRISGVQLEGVGNRLTV
jgi:endonuclease/exonuclease/phosphatase family metal-dependent hydrolase